MAAPIPDMVADLRRLKAAWDAEETKLSVDIACGNSNDWHSRRAAYLASAVEAALPLADEVDRLTRTIERMLDRV